MALANLKLQENLRDMAVRDPLTGLFNRRYLEETLEREFRRATRQGAPIALIMLDIDHFKRCNDTYGHDAGDVLLRELGVFLQRYCRGSDVACRYGGEEFVLTRKGERCMLPEFGSDIPDLPFEPNDQQTVNQANSSVSSAVGAWDDRIKFVKMDGQIKENELDFQITIQNAKSPNKDATQVVNIQVTPSIVGGM